MSQSAKEIAALKKSVASLAEHNKEVLGQLGELATSGGGKINKKLSELITQAEKIKNDLAPKVKDLAESSKPVIEKGVAVSKETATAAKDKLVNDVLPATASAVGTALAIVEVLRNRAPEEIVEAVEPPKKPKTAKWILAGVGFAAVAGLSVAAYRMLTVADEHWIGIEDEFTEA